MCTTYVLIADSAHAKLLERNDREELTEVDSWTNPFGHSADHDIAQDKQGSDRGGTLESEVSPKRHEQLKFVKRIAGELTRHSSNFDQLIVSAAPQVLGDLRKELKGTVKAKIDREFPKSLVNVPLHDLPEHLAKLLASASEGI